MAFIEFFARALWEEERFFVCRLKEDNSNLYLDGSQANLTGPEGDVMVVFLELPDTR